MTTSAPICDELTKEWMIKSDLRLADLSVSQHGDILRVRTLADGHGFICLSLCNFMLDYRACDLDKAAGWSVQ